MCSVNVRILCSNLRKRTTIKTLSNDFSMVSVLVSVGIGVGSESVVGFESVCILDNIDLIKEWISIDSSKNDETHDSSSGIC